MHEPNGILWYSVPSHLRSLPASMLHVQTSTEGDKRRHDSCRELDGGMSRIFDIEVVAKQEKWGAANLVGSDEKSRHSIGDGWFPQISTKVSF